MCVRIGAVAETCRAETVSGSGDGWRKNNPTGERCDIKRECGWVGRSSRVNRSPPRLATTLERSTYPTATPPAPSYPQKGGAQGRHSRTPGVPIDKSGPVCIFFCARPGSCACCTIRPRQELARPRSPPPANLNRIRRVSLVELISVSGDLVMVGACRRRGGQSTEEEEIAVRRSCGERWLRAYEADVACPG
jgi:hypothetical protein